MVNGEPRQARIVSRLEGGGERLLIEIEGRFDFGVQKAFRAAYLEHPEVGVYVVDLSRVDYMDSAALGMLLLLREHAGDLKDRVRLRAPGDQVRKILEVANFHKLFHIE